MQIQFLSILFLILNVTQWVQISFHVTLCSNKITKPNENINVKEIVARTSIRKHKIFLYRLGKIHLILVEDMKVKKNYSKLLKVKVYVNELI